MKSKKLSDNFLPKLYQLEPSQKNLHKVVIHGQRIGRPSHRLTFHQSGLKVIAAQILSNHKNKQIQHQIVRINHLPSFEEVRIHTHNLQYPGEYAVELTFSGIDYISLKKQLLKKLKSDQMHKVFPAIAEEHAGEAKIEF